MNGAAIFPWLTISLCVITGVSLFYLLAAVVAVARWHMEVKPNAEYDDSDLPPVSILKPLCGDERELYSNLATFCRQRYSRYQIVFGVMDKDDPGLAAVQRLKEDYPDIDMALIVDPSQVGANRKVSNLSNMMKAAKHDLIVISDSDISVTPAYLRTIIRELLSPGVGLVTCLYRGRPSRNLFSRLGAMYINEWFLPSVLVGRLLGYRRFSFGSTVAIKRNLLEAVGGLSIIAGQLADDYLLGELVRKQGLKTVLSEYLVTTTVAEETLHALSSHELRWARTIRSVQPVGYASSFITHAIPIGLMAVAITRGSLETLVIFGAIIAMRIGLHVLAMRALNVGKLWEAILVPIRDIATFIFFCRGFSGRQVSWRTNQFSLRADGSLHPPHKVETP